METFRTSDGRTLAYKVMGSGPMLVCHPGGPGYASSELDDLGGLSASRTLVVLDPRGTGGSDPAAAYSLDGYAADLDELRAHLGLERMDLLGYSHGGTVALHYAARHRDGVQRLVLVGPATRFTDEAKAFADEYIASKAGEPWYADAVAAMDEDFSADDDPGAQWLRVAPFYFARWDDAFMPAMLAETAGASNAPALGYERGLDVRDELSDITAPTLIVSGAQDFVCSPRAVEGLASGIAGAQMVILQNAGHVPYVEQPEAFRTAVEEFLGG